MDKGERGAPAPHGAHSQTLTVTTKPSSFNTFHPEVTDNEQRQYLFTYVTASIICTTRHSQYQVKCLMGVLCGEERPGWAVHPPQLPPLSNMICTHRVPTTG